MDVLTLERQGLALKAAGRLDEAIAVFKRLVKLAPREYGAHYNLGNAYLAANRLPDAVAAYRAAIRLMPSFAPAYNNMGLALLTLGQAREAAEPLRRAASLDPGNAGSQHLAGHALLQSGQAEAALPYLRAAHRMAPGVPAVLTDLADALRRTGHLLEVAPLARAAAAGAPHMIAVWNNLANAEREAGEFAAAAAASRRALAINPQDADAHANLALTLLAAGDLAAAWPHWEYRWAGLARKQPPLPGPVWDGAPVSHGILYLHAEQGLGDTLQFCRYVPLAAERGRVVLAVQRPLLRLLRTLPGQIEMIADRDPAPGYAAQAPLMSLPGAFRTTLETIPSTHPYLAADPALAALWARDLATLPGLRVGLVWAGGRDFPFDHARSIPPALLTPLGAVAGVSFVSLQVGATAKPGFPLADWTDALGDFADTAALIAGLDLVIGCDTAVIHLAGAMGRPAWLLNRFAGDWRWGAAGESCAWYPTVRVFRQTAPGDWEGVVAEVAAALRAGIFRV
jgi:Flp pilus assembly protein TadD